MAQLIKKVILHSVGGNFYQVTWLYESNGGQAIHEFPKELGDTALANVEALLVSGYQVEPNELLEELRWLHRSPEKDQPEITEGGNPAFEQHVLNLLKRAVTLLLVSEVAARLGVTTSRVHNRIAQDKEPRSSRQYFPSARLATYEEVAALVILGRVKVWTPKGVTVIKRSDVDALQGSL